MANESICKISSDHSEQKRKEYLNFFAFYDYTKPTNSLELVCSNLNEKNESQLASFLTKRIIGTSLMSRPNEGSFFTLELSVEKDEGQMKTVICYHTPIFINEGEGGGAKLEVGGAETHEGDAISEVGGAETDDATREFIVCLLISSEVNLEFFRPELQEFCSYLSSQTGDDKNAFISYLNGWYDATVQYLYRCVDHMGADVSLLFHSASMNRFLDVNSENEDVKVDVLRFLHSCDLSELISGTTSDVRINEAQLSNKLNKTHLQLHVNEDKSYKFSETECDAYCEDWAKVILEGDKNDPMFIKSVIENFKLTTVQSMNTFKRLVTDAESNHYALYRAFLFLQKSKQKEMLLENAKLEEGIVSSAEALDVISVLEQLI